MNIKNIIKDNIVNPEISNNSSSLVGTIVSVNENKLASVELTGRTGDKFILDNIPMMSNGRGIIANNFYPGDKVIVSFNSGNINAAKITGMYHSGASQLLNDTFHRNQELSLNVKENSIKNIMTQSQMYKTNATQITDYTKSFNFDKSVIEDLRTVGFYKPHDIGLTHPINKSTIKIMDDGAILISSGTDTCICLSDNGEVTINAKSINIVSNLDINIDSYKDVNITCNKFNVKESGGQ